MKFYSCLIILIWSFLSFAGARPDYACEPDSKVTASDYNFSVVPIKVLGRSEIAAEAPLDLSVYEGRTLILNVFSPHCGWCMADLYYHTKFQQEAWSDGDVVMVNLSFGSPEDSDPQKTKFDSSPSGVWDYITGGYQETQLGEDISLENVDFYHIVDARLPGEEGSAFSALDRLASSQGEPLFLEMTGTPYGVVIDKTGKVRFRGNFTVGDEEWTEKFERHYGFVSSLVDGSCQAP